MNIRFGLTCQMRNTEEWLEEKKQCTNPDVSWDALHELRSAVMDIGMDARIHGPFQIEGRNGFAQRGMQFCARM